MICVHGTGLVGGVLKLLERRSIVGSGAERARNRALGLHTSIPVPLARSSTSPKCLVCPVPPPYEYDSTSPDMKHGLDHKLDQFLTTLTLARLVADPIYAQDCKGCRETPNAGRFQHILGVAHSPTVT